MNIGEKFYCSKCLLNMEEEGVCPHCGYDPSGAPEADALEEGTVFFGRYQLGTVISRSSSGITYAAWDLTEDMPVMIKEYFPEDYATRDLRQMDELHVLPQTRPYYLHGMRNFVREAEIMAALHDLPTVADVYGCFEQNNTTYIIMQYIRE